MVEQGTENPRVGGSTPSLATILPLILLASGCGADPCDRLCDRVGNRLETCLETWPATWEDLDATSKLDFQQVCRQDWDQARADLEPRQLDDALAQCELALDELAAMRQDGTVCDQLRAVYID